MFQICSRPPKSAAELAKACVGCRVARPVPAKADTTACPPPTHSGGVYAEKRCALKPKKLDHAVVLVGFGTREGEDYWIVRNSWSKVRTARV